MNGFGWRHAGRRSWALRGIDLRIERGERVLLLGASGSGKSTLLAALAGLLADDSGEREGTLAVADVRRGTLLQKNDQQGAPPYTRPGVLFQDPQTQLVMARAGDDVAFGLENLGVPASQIWPRVDDALTQATFPYGRDRRTDALSGGEQQRLALAGVLALDPTLVLLDEPTTNLDPTGADLVRKAIAELRDRTLVLVEHRVADALPLVDRIVVLEAGSVRADGKPSTVLAQHADHLARAGIWVPGLPVPTRRAVGGRGDLLLRGRSLSYRYPGGTATAPADLDAYAGEALAVHGPSGAGKSTLLMMLGGLLPPTTGTLTAPGRPTPPHRWRAPDLASRIGTVFQNPRHQFLSATVRDELALGPRRAGQSNVDRTVDDLLDRLHLAHLAAANPHTLSGGEQRRLSVATVLAAAPALLLLDEPTFGQDRRTWLELLDLFAALRDEGRGLVAATHDTDFAAALADRTVHLAAA